jgi:hypothetical protein
MLFQLRAQPQINIDGAEQLIKDLLLLTKKEVLVGVPEEKDSRKEGEIGNAALAHIHDKGSPLAGIPARPFMIPGINNAQEKINIHLIAAAKAQLENAPDKVSISLNRAGIVAASSIKNVINDGEGFEPLKRATLLGRLRQRKAAKKWNKDKREDVMSSMHPLIDTGSLRNSVSYVVKDTE